MNFCTFTFRKFVFVLLMLVSLSSQAKKLTRINPPTNDSSKVKLNMDAVYNRPFLSMGKLPVAIGGYLEANTQYATTNGATNGFSFQMRRMTLFVSSTIGKKIKFLTELELEEGTKEINLEYCAMDIEFHPLLNFRGGIIMNPIGAYNQNHDAPRWDFIDRPIVATGIIPSTLSNVGFGIHGKKFKNSWVVGYELYLTNGFDDKLIANSEGRTSFHAAKENTDKFEESNSGIPMFTGKIAIRNRNIGEIGFSYLDGVYNKWMLNGIPIEKKRHARIMAVDYNTSLLKNKLNIVGEAAYAAVDVPYYLRPTYGTHQWGMYTDIVYTFLQGSMFGWDKAKLNLGIRTEYTDFNTGSFETSKSTVGDAVFAIVPSIAFRPNGNTVIRLNFRSESSSNLINSNSRSQNIQFGFSSYF